MNRKGLEEKREELKQEMQSILDQAKTETRSLNEAEIKKFDELENEIKNIDLTIEREERMDKMENKEIKVENNELTAEEKRYYTSIEERDDYNRFADYIRNTTNNVETRANLTKGDNGAVIPQTIVNKIITKLQEISPLYAMSTHYVMAGNLSIPVEDTSSDAITVAYATEFEDVTAHANKFASIQLSGYLYAALTKVSRSLLRNSNFDLVTWVINKMVTKIASFIEKECLYGTTSKTKGVVGSYDTTNMKVTTASKSAVTADELIDLQELIPDAYQANAIWIMSKATRKAIRKLKDQDGQYLLNKDLTAKWGYTLLGRDVYVSDNVVDLGTASKAVVFYGDFSGLAVKESGAIELQVLDQTYASQSAIGIMAWSEIDAAVEDKQKLAVLVTASA